MSGFRFLSLAEILEIHQDQVTRYGGAPGIRDLTLIKSAAAMPAATCFGEYLHAGIFEMAAAYLFHLVNNHPFIDGNKRTGVVSALVFLALNGYGCTATQDQLASLVMAAASGEIQKRDISLFFRQWSVKKQ